jgi:hypothetical protein
MSKNTQAVENLVATSLPHHPIINSQGQRTTDLLAQSTEYIKKNQREKIKFDHFPGV